jgi:hypothetical protein
VFVHVPEQVVEGALQTVPHVPPAQTVPVVHAFPHLPQLLLSVVVLVQAPLQNVCVPGHVQLLLVHDSPPPHTVPQVPQLLLSVAVLVHVPLHDV